MNEKISIHNRNYEVSRKGVDNWKISQNERKKFLEFLDELELGRVNRGKKISENRLCKYITTLKMPLEYFGKDIEKIKVDDIKKFEKDLISGKIKTRSNTEYSQNSQIDTKKILKIYFKWRIGESKALDLVGWFDTRHPKKTPDFLNEKEIELLYRSCRNARERYLIAILFDSGARAEEFLNIRYEDVFMPNDNTNFIKIALKEEYSKTNGRTISLYWKHSLEAVRDYLRERRGEGVKSKDPVFTGTYDQARAYIRRLGEKVLGKRIHFHLFRHSSATYYASKLNRQQLCIRYGWAFSSDMPDTYISRAGVNDKELDDKMAGVEIEKVKDDFIRKEQEFKMKQEEMEEKIKSLKEDLKKEMNEHMKTLIEDMNETGLKISKRKIIKKT